MYFVDLVAVIWFLDGDESRGSGSVGGNVREGRESGING